MRDVNRVSYSSQSRAFALYSKKRNSNEIFHTLKRLQQQKNASRRQNDTLTILCIKCLCLAFSWQSRMAQYVSLRIMKILFRTLTCRGIVNVRQMRLRLTNVADNRRSKGFPPLPFFGRSIYLEINASSMGFAADNKTPSTVISE